MFDLDLGVPSRQEEPLARDSAPDQGGAAQGAQAAGKDYLLYPLLSGPGFRRTLAANATANLARNLWSHSVIMCGHFPEGVQAFEQEVLDENETRGSGTCGRCWGSANISGGPVLHLMTGNLSHQIEHHLFPTCPASGTARSRPGQGPLPEVRPQLQLAAPGRQVPSPGTR